MHKASIAIGIIISILAPSCGSSDAEIAGKATFAVDDITATLDTGNDGKVFVTNDDKWSAFCNRKNNAIEMTLSYIPMENPPLGHVWLWTKSRNDAGAELLNATVRQGPHYYDGFCPLTTDTDEDSGDVTFSATNCNLQRQRDGRNGTLVSAVFHVKNCRD